MNGSTLAGIVLKTYFWPSVLFFIGAAGLWSYCQIDQRDNDPQVYYVTAGRILGRPTVMFAGNMLPDDPFLPQASQTGALLVDFPPQLPYRDFVSEYPPAALALMIIPRLFTDDVATYCTLFGIEMALPAVGLLWLAIQMARLVRPGQSDATGVVGGVAGGVAAWVSAGWAAWVWAAGMVLLHRFDVFVVFIVALGILMILRQRWGIAGALIGWGVAIKVYPVFLLLPMGIIAWGDGRWRTTLHFFVSATIVPLLFHGALMPWAGWQVWNYFLFHSKRGIEVEAIWAQTILFANYLRGHVITSEAKYGSVQLASGDVSRLWVIASYVTMLIANLACAWIALKRISQIHSSATQRCVRILALATACITFSAVTAKVLSAQYLFWLCPMVMILPNRSGKLIAITYLAALIAGQLYWPTNWIAVAHLTLGGQAIVFVRNVLLLAVGMIAARWREPLHLPD